jgi:hypothetical protein
MVVELVENKGGAIDVRDIHGLSHINKNFVAFLN